MLPPIRIECVSDWLSPTWIGCPGTKTFRHSGISSHLLRSEWIRLSNQSRLEWTNWGISLPLDTAIPFESVRQLVSHSPATCTDQEESWANLRHKRSLPPRHSPGQLLTLRPWLSTKSGTKNLLPLTRGKTYLTQKPKLYHSLPSFTNIAWNTWPVADFTGPSLHFQRPRPIFMVTGPRKMTENYLSML